MRAFLLKTRHLLCWIESANTKISPTAPPLEKMFLVARGVFPRLRASLLRYAIAWLEKGLGLLVLPAPIS